MLRVSFIVTLISGIFFSGGWEKSEIRTSLQLNITKGKEGCRNIFVQLSVKNYGTDPVYIERFKPAVLTIRRRNDNGDYKDYTSNWLHSELQMAEQNASVKAAYSTNRVYDPLSGQFTDPVTSQFFNETIKIKGMYLKTRTDSLLLKTWTRTQFEGILYLKPQETWESVESINSLPSGEYMISFEFSNSAADERFHPHELLKKLNLELPGMIGAYRKWTGNIQSDNLLIEIE
jgi:hypothetical protein